jgi:hypothetical protein
MIDSAKIHTEPTHVTPLLDLPLEIFSEILSLTSSPKDLLAVMSTCKLLCGRLLSPGLAFVWKNMFVKVGLPDPSEIVLGDSDTEFKSVGLFEGRESAFASFVFDGGICEVGHVFFSRFEGLSTDG